MGAVKRTSPPSMVPGALLALAAFILAACASAPRDAPPPGAVRTVPPAALAAALPPGVVQEYRIHPGDVIDVKFFHSPELNEQVTVRPDGRISIQLAHEVMAAGLTPPQLEKVLTENVSSELRKPVVTVIVRSFNTPVYVDGEVFRPGAVTLIGTITVLQAIAQAGGMRETARAGEVIVIRRGPKSEPVAVPVDVSGARGADPAQNIVLQPFDVVFVPRKPIVNVNVWIDQYIRKNIPIGIGFGYDLNPD